MAQRQSLRFQWIRGLLLGGLALSLWACQNASSPPQGQVTDNPASPDLSNPSPEPTSPSPVPDGSPTPDVQPAPKAKVAVYWLVNEAEKISLAPPAVLSLPNKNIEPSEQLTQALERLFQGPANADVFSTIPEGTKLNKVQVKTDGVHVDVSQEFTTGGGSASMQGRLGQLLYTASSLDPEERIWISIDGEPLTVLGGEGLEISQPMTRKEFQTEFSL